MNEDQIERWYEREMNQIDNDFMNGRLTQKEYDNHCKQVEYEVNEMYHTLKNSNCRF